MSDTSIPDSFARQDQAIRSLRADLEDARLRAEEQERRADRATRERDALASGGRNLPRLLADSDRLQHMLRLHGCDVAQVTISASPPSDEHPSVTITLWGVEHVIDSEGPTIKPPRPDVVTLTVAVPAGAGIAIAESDFLTVVDGSADDHRACVLASSVNGEEVQA